MTSIENVRESYFSWNPLNDPEFDPFIIGNGPIGGKGRSLLFAVRALWDSESDDLRAVVLPRSRYIGTDIFEKFISGIPCLDDLVKNASPEDLEA